MVANRLPGFTGPQRHASSADKLDLNVRHSQMCSGQWLNSILTETPDIRVTQQKHLDWTTCNLRVTTMCHHLKHKTNKTLLDTRTGAIFLVSRNIVCDCNIMSTCCLSTVFPFVSCILHSGSSLAYMLKTKIRSHNCAILNNLNKLQVT